MPFLSQRLGDRLAEHDATVLGGVVEIDVQVALGLERDVDQGVAGQLLQHVVEEADAGGDVIGASAVEIDGRLDLRLLGGAIDSCLPLHGKFALLAPLRPSVYQLGRTYASDPSGYASPPGHIGPP